MHSHHIVSIDELACHCGMADWNSSLKAAFAALSLVLVVTLTEPAFWVLNFVFLTGLLLTVGKIPLRDYLHLLQIPVLFLLLGGVTILLQFGTGMQAGALQHRLWQLSFPHFAVFITQQSLQQAAFVTLRAFSAFSALFLLTLSTPMNDLLQVLRRIHVPALILELMVLIYRYIFLLADTNRRQKDAARSRLGYDGFAVSLHTFGSEMANLLILSMKRSQATYDAMEARGCDGTFRLWEEKRPLTAPAVGSVVLYLLLSVIVIHIF